MKFFLAAGGTGGHIFPALAVAEALKLAGHETIFLGVGKALEEKLIRGSGYKLEVIPFVPVSGSGLRGALRLSFALPGALAHALRIFRRERPAALLAFGGYPSFVPILAARILQVPRAVHEQNGKVGLANRFLARLSNRVYAVPGATGFPKSVERRVTNVPNPVRRAFYEIPEWKAPEAGLPLRILVVGGSQGAHAVNKAVASLAELFLERNVSLVHQTGVADEAKMKTVYSDAGLSAVRVLPFIDDIVAEYAAAHLVICRAGAMTAAEVAASGRPAIFVPLVIAGGHQQENIRDLLAHGGALKVEQHDGLHTELKNTLLSLLNDHARLATIAAQARAYSRLGEETSAEFLAKELEHLAEN